MTPSTDSRRIVSSSLVVGGFARLLRGSVVAAAIAAIARSGRRVADRCEAFVRRRLVPDPRRDADARLLIEDNTLFRWINGRTDRVAAAWNQSAAAGLLRPIADDLRRAEPWYIVRLIGWMVMVAAIVYRLIVGFRDPLITRGSIASWIALIAVGAMLMAMPRSIGAAWQAKFSKDRHTSDDDIRT